MSARGPGPALALALALLLAAPGAGCLPGRGAVAPEDTAEVWDSLEQERGARNPAAPPPEEEESTPSELLDFGTDLFLVVGVAALAAFAWSAPRSRRARAAIAALLLGGAAAVVAWAMV